MEKALAILEKHVQWIAIGLGALFLVFMVYSYALQDPVTVVVPGQSKPLTPGELDQTIYESPELAKVREGMRNGKGPDVRRQLPPIKGLTEAFAPILEPVRVVGGGTSTPNIVIPTTTPVAPEQQPFTTLVV